MGGAAEYISSSDGFGGWVVVLGGGTGATGFKLIPSKSFAPWEALAGGLGAASVFFKKPNFPVDAG